MRWTKLSTGTWVALAAVVAVCAIAWRHRGEQLDLMDVDGGLP